VADIEISICIATLNRAGFLGATLESIVSQATDAVEIVILDGGSTDGTDALVAEWQQRFPRLRYQREPVAGGADHDFAKAVALARGRYCWLFTDDDILKPGAIEAVLSKVGEGHDLIVVNAEVRSASLDRIILKNRIRMNTDRVYRTNEQAAFFVDASVYLSFIGGVVIRRDVWDGREKEPYFGCQFIHYAVIFQQPFAGTVLVIARPLICIRYGNAMWTSRSFEIWMLNWPDLVWSMPFPDDDKKRVTAREPWQSVPRLLLSRAVGAYSMKEYRNFLRGRTNSALRRLVCVAIASAPGPLLNIVALTLLTLALGRSLPGVDLRMSRFYGPRWLRQRFASSRIAA
jgi:abequosyltransferase